jgi:release factor glutamine methyltransferase
MSKSIGDALTIASAALGNDPSDRRDAALLLGHATGLSHSQLIACPETLICAQQHKQLQELIEQRRLGQPMAYLLGTKAFWDLDFKVTPDTLIPRPETELLIEIILSQPHTGPKTLIDLGTGSGIIAATIAQARPDWSVIATDESFDALRVAQHNGAGMRNLNFVAGNWLTCFGGVTFDIIVANPPYIDALDAHLPALVYEPRSALVSEDDGFRDLKGIIHQSTALLADSGYLLLEHGYTQQAAVTREMALAGYESTAYSDLADNPRAVMGYRKEAS